MERKFAAVLSILFLTSMLVLPVMAQEPFEIPTEAVVTGQGTPPFFKWKWELPDDDPGIPCTQIWPEPFGVRIVTCYLVATDPNGAADIQRVFIKVFHPDGTEKYQVETMEIPREGPEIMEAIDIGVDHGCIPLDVAVDMKTELSKNEARAFKAEFELHYHQPPGEYRVVGYAVDTGGNVGSWENFFTYYSLKYINIDFGAGINFGEIVPSVWQVVSGDEDMTTPEKPTVQSGGNDPILISLHFTTMVGATLGKEIEEFDSTFLGERLEFMACEWVTFSNPLLPCNTEQIDFSVHAPIGTPSDVYFGTLHLMIDGDL